MAYLSLLLDFSLLYITAAQRMNPTGAFRRIAAFASS